MKIIKGLYLILTPKSDRWLIKSKSNEYIKPMLELNPRDRMLSRQAGFEDGYIQAMKDFGLEFRYND